MRRVRDISLATAHCRCGHMALDHAADMNGDPIGWCYQCGCSAFVAQAGEAVVEAEVEEEGSE